MARSRRSKTRGALAMLAMLAVLAALGGCSIKVTPAAVNNIEGSIGLSIDLFNGSPLKVAGKPVPLTLLKTSRKFYIDQLRFQVLQLNYPDADVLDWLTKTSELSTLSWTGVQAVKTDWEAESPAFITYTEQRGQAGAEWMVADDYTFTIEMADAAGQVVPGTQRIELRPRDYMIRRRVGLSWFVGQPARGDMGTNKGKGAITVKGGGAFTGQKNDIYQVKVVQGGLLDGTALVAVTSVLGDNDPVVPPGPPPKGPPVGSLPVTSGQAIPISKAGLGPTITFTDTSPAADQTLVLGDRWLIRSYADGGKECLAAAGCSSGVCATPPGPPGQKGTCQTLSAAVPGIQATAHAMAEIRYGVPDLRVHPFSIPAEVKQLRIVLSARPEKVYVLPVEHASAPTVKSGEADIALDYGLEVAMSYKPPANLRYFVPGEKVEGEITLTDGGGTRLHQVGQLPTYRDFLDGKSHGLVYFKNETTPSGWGYFAESRVNATIVALTGPKQDVVTNYRVGEPEGYYVGEDQKPPIGGVAIGGLRDAKLWETPIASTFGFELPKDAKSGTYVLIARAARYFMGQRVYRLVTTEIQVGTERPTDYQNRTGNCEVCHAGNTSLGRLRHGTSEHRFCVACHPVDHGGPVAVYIKTIHFNSPNYLLPRNDCTLCHIQPGANVRASKKICGSCHQTIHPGEPGLEVIDEFEHCGTSCHRDEPLGHVRIPPQ